MSAPTVWNPDSMIERTPSAALVQSDLLQRIHDIAETLDTLETELHGEQQACDRLDQVIARIQQSLAKNGTQIGVATVTQQTRSDESLRSMRAQLAELAQVIDQELANRPVLPHAVSANAVTAETRDRSRLDAVMSQVAAANEFSESDWLSQHGAVATRMSNQLAQLSDVSQALCSRAAVLDSEATDLTSQWEVLRREQEMLDLIRTQLGNEREELTLQRDLLIEETERFNRCVELSYRRVSEAEATGYGDDSQNSDASHFINGGSAFDAHAALEGETVGRSTHDSRWSLEEPIDDWSVTKIPTPESNSIPTSSVPPFDIPGMRAPEYQLATAVEDLQLLVEEIDPVDAVKAESAYQSEVDEDAVAPETDSAEFETDVACIGDVEVLEDEDVFVEEAVAEEAVAESGDDDSAAADAHAVQINDEVHEEPYIEADSTHCEDAVYEDVENEDVEVESELIAEEDVSKDEIPSEGFSALGSREAAVAELDALLAAYASSVGAEGLDEELSAVMSMSKPAARANNFEADADEEEVVDESTLELASGETWYEGQSLEGESEFEEPVNEIVEDVVDDVVDEDDLVYEEQPQPDAEPLDAIEQANEMVAHTERLIDALRQDEPLQDEAGAAASEHVDSHSEVAAESLESIEDAPVSFFGSESTTDVDADIPAGSLLSQLERKPTENAESEKLHELRSQLADLFGIKNAPQVAAADIVEDKPLAERFNSFYTGGNSVDELEEAGALTQPANPVAALASQNVDAAPASPSSSVTKPVPSTLEPAATEADDPIRAYMAQLLARTRQSNPNHRSEEKESPRSEGTSTIEGLSTLANEVLPASKSADQDYSWLSEGPKHKQNKEAVRASMQQLRQLANMQARSAVVRAGRKQLKTQILTKSAGTILCLGIGGIALVTALPPMFGYMLSGLGMVIACDLLLTLMRHWRVLTTRVSIVPDVLEEESPGLKADPRTEGRLEQFTKAVIDRP